MRQIWLLLVLTGCSSSLQGERTVTDDLGRTVHVPPKINRVAPLAPSITELLFAAGAGAKVAGVSTVDNFPPAVYSLPRYSAVPLDIEAIVALDVDLVLASEQVNTPGTAATFTAVGIPVYFVTVSALEDVTRVIRDLGELLQTSEAASHRAVELEDSLRQLSMLTADIPEPPDILFLIDYMTLYAFGQGSYIHSIIQIAGGRSITESLSARFPILTDEFVLTANPDVIAGSFGMDFEMSRLLVYHPTWDILPAVTSNQVHGLEADLYLRPGPRLIAGAWKLAAVLHPAIIMEP